MHREHRPQPRMAPPCAYGKSRQGAIEPADRHASRLGILGHVGCRGRTQPSPMQRAPRGYARAARLCRAGRRAADRTRCVGRLVRVAGSAAVDHRGLSVSGQNSSWLPPMAEMGGPSSTPSLDQGYAHHLPAAILPFSLLHDGDRSAVTAALAGYTDRQYLRPSGCRRVSVPRGGVGLPRGAGWPSARRLDRPTPG